MKTMISIRKPFTDSDIELICELPKQCLTLTKTFFVVSYCLCLFGEFAKVFERHVWRVQVAHLHSGAHALSSPSRCFQLSTNLDNDLFGCFLCWDARTIFTNIMCFFHIVKLYTTKIKYTRSFDNSTNKIEIFIQVD